MKITDAELQAEIDTPAENGFIAQALRELRKARIVVEAAREAVIAILGEPNCEEMVCARIEFALDAYDREANNER